MTDKVRVEKKKRKSKRDCLYVIVARWVHNNRLEIWRDEYYFGTKQEALDGWDHHIKHFYPEMKDAEAYVIKLEVETSPIYKPGVPHIYQIGNTFKIKRKKG